jgi:hypothetical protein
MVFYTTTWDKPEGGSRKVDRPGYTRCYPVGTHPDPRDPLGPDPEVGSASVDNPPIDRGFGGLDSGSG